MAGETDAEARALKRERTADQIQRYARTKDAFVGVRFSGGPAHQPRCAMAAEIDGKLLAEPPMLPLDGCDQARCCCAWRGVSKWEAKRTVKSQG